MILNGLKTILKRGNSYFLRDLFIYDGVESIHFTEDTLIFAKEFNGLPGKG